jgi:hypothetical protein
MAMLRTCTTNGCETKTLGDQCLEHELPRSLALLDGPAAETANPQPANGVRSSGYQTNTDPHDV